MSRRRKPAELLFGDRPELDPAFGPVPPPRPARPEPKIVRTTSAEIRARRAARRAAEQDREPEAAE